MKTRPSFSLWQLPSLLCLDAPLVAVGWAILLARSVENTKAHSPYFLGLFCTVWSIYLFDRIFDTTKQSQSHQTPVRHAWARKNRGILSVLFAISSLALVILACTEIDLSLWKKVWPVGLATLVYFTLFLFRRFPGFSSLPAKEIMIGACFAGGVFVASELTLFSEGGSIEISALTLWLGCAVLFTWNCLLIAQAEVAYDREHDPSSYFAQEAPPALPNRLCFSLVIVLSVGLWFASGAHGKPAFSLLVCGFLLFWLGERKQNTAATPALADGILLFPWLILGISYLTR